MENQYIKKLDLEHHIKSSFNFFVIHDELEGKEILKASSIFSAFQCGSLPPNSNEKPSQKVISLLDNELQTKLKKNFVKLIANSQSSIKQYLGKCVHKGITQIKIQEGGIDIVSSIIGNIAPLTICHLLEIPEEDRSNFLALFRKSFDSSGNNNCDDLYNYLSIHLAIKLGDRKSNIYFLFGQLIESDNIDFKDAVYNSSLFIEASLNTVLSEMICSLTIFSELADRNLDFQDMHEKCKLVSKPIKYIFRRVEESCVSNSIKMSKGDIIAIKVIDNLHFGYGKHSCPGKNLSLLILDKFINAIQVNFTSVKALKIKRASNNVALSFDYAFFEFT